MSYFGGQWAKEDPARKRQCGTESCPEGGCVRLSGLAYYCTKHRLDIIKGMDNQEFTLIPRLGTLTNSLSQYTLAPQLTVTRNQKIWAAYDQFLLVFHC